MDKQQYNFGIVGAGPAGYSAAIRASQLGKSVVLFEKENLGGVCLNKGCIPTKTFLHCADVYNSLKKASNLGIEIENYSINFEKAAERKDKTVEKIRKSLEMLLKSYDIEIVMAEAKIIDNEGKKAGRQEGKLKNSSQLTAHCSLIEASGEIYECENILIATGSEPKCVGGFEFDHEFILSSDDVLNLKTLPKKVLIVGSGAIGVEWARIFSSFGVETSIVEIEERLLHLADFEVSARLERMFKMARIKAYTSTHIKEIRGKCVTLSNGDVLEPDFILFATGRAVNVLSYANDNEIASVDNQNQTTKPMSRNDVKLIGDCYGSIQLAHFASHQGVNVIENIVLGKEIKGFVTPLVVYGHPEIAWAGKCEQDLIAENIEYKKSVFPVSALGKAHADGDLEGFVKILSDNEGKILGAHIIAKEASAMIHQLTIAMQTGLKVQDLKHCCFAHPTYSEGIYESLLGLDNESLAMLKSER